MNRSSLPLRRLFKVVNGGTPTSEAENWGGGVPWATPVDLSSGSMVISKTQRTLTRLGVHDGSSIVPRGSILLSTRAPIGYTAITEVPMAFNQGCRALVPAGEVDVRFIRYQLEARGDDLQAAGMGTTFSELSSGSLAGFEVECPQLADQRRISDFLDAEVGRIGRTMKALKRLDSTMREREDSLVELVLSRIFYQSQGLVPLKRFCGPRDVRLGIGRSASLLSVSIHRGVIPRGELTDRESRAEEFSNYKECFPGDVVINRMRAFQGAVGVADIPGIVSPDYLVLRLGDSLDARFAHHLLRSRWAIGEMSSRIRGIGSVGQGNVRTPRVNWSDLGGVEIPRVSLSIQRSAVGDIESDLSKSSRLKSVISRKINILEERKRALITAAVTGQIDVTTARGADVS